MELVAAQNNVPVFRGVVFRTFKEGFGCSQNLGDKRGRAFPEKPEHPISHRLVERQLAPHRPENIGNCRFTIASEKPRRVGFDIGRPLALENNIARAVDEQVNVVDVSRHLRERLRISERS